MNQVSRKIPLFVVVTLWIMGLLTAINPWCSILDYEVVDLEDIAPRSIILGQRGKWLELLEPKRAFVFYQDIDTGKSS